MRIPRPATILALLALLLGGLLLPAPRPAAARAAACFQETGFCVQGRFLAYWQANGGLARNGFPLGEERQELLEDGQTYTVQYFERVRLELHPDNPPPYDVLLGQFGRRFLQLPGQRNFRGPEPPAAPLPGQTYFAETGHNVAPDFLAYWQANGGLAQFGYPLAEAGLEQLGDRFYTTQYFERARLERHPENAAPYDIQLGQFGRAILAQAALLSGDLGALYTTSERARLLLGRPSAPAVQTQGVVQAFEGGRMLYRGDLRRIYVLCGDAPTGRLASDPAAAGFREPSYLDTWAEGSEPGGGPAPTPGLFLPQRGFGKVWREHQEVRDCLGYARTADEQAYPQAVQDFESGVLLAAPDGRSAYAFTSESFGSAGSIGRYERLPFPAR